VGEDAFQTARDIPAVGRAVVAAIRLARRSRGGAGAATAPTATPPALPAGADEESVTFPMATIFVDAEGWTARAQSLGGTSNALAVGVAARLAQRVGRAAADGSVLVGMPVNERAPGDTRANAVSNVNVPVDDPALATTDLREIRTAVRQVLIRHREVGDEEQAVNAIVPLLTQRILRGINARTVVPSNAVGSSNLGVVNPAVSRPDGTDADYFAIVNNFLRVSKAKMLRRGGMQSMVSGRARGLVFITVASYHPDRPSSNDVLRQDLLSAVSDFSLTGTHL
jgi:hypothetical protein